MMKKVFILLSFTLFLWGCESNSADFGIIEIGEESLMVEMADTPAKRQQGLMFRETLPINLGMLFVFETESVQKIWMKNTLIPLKIIWISSNKEVVDIQNAEPCKADPCPVYKGNSPAKMVLEVNQGVFEGLKIGEDVKINVY